MTFKTRLLFCFFIFMIISFYVLYAIEPVLYIKVMRDTVPWYNDGWGGEYKESIKAGTIIYPQWNIGKRDINIGYSDDNNYYHGINEKNVHEFSHYYVNICDIELPGSDRFSREILLESWGDIIWMPWSYIELILSKKQKCFIKLYEKTNYYRGNFYPTTYAINDMYMSWTNGSEAYANFVIKNIKKIRSNTYRVHVSTLQNAENKLLLFQNLLLVSDAIFYVEYIDHKISVYSDFQEKPFWEFVKVKKELFDIVYSYANTGQLPSDFDIKDYLVSDISKPWPLRNLKDIQAEFIPVRPANPTRKIIKQTSLYTLPYISSGEKITALAPNALVYELETGSYAILGKDKAPWLHVETKDGLRGWLWGGFTEIIEGSSSPNTTNFSTYPYTVTDNLRLRKTSDLKSEIVTTLPKNTRLALVSKGKTQTIDGITAPWVQVKTEAGETGWCFGGFLDPKP